MIKLFDLLTEDWELNESILMGELLNPDESFNYEGDKGLHFYKDSLDNEYFVRLTYQPTDDPYFEFKTGWFEDNNKSKPRYDPPLPPNTTALDNNKRGNTVAKIYRDELIPRFIQSNLSNQLIIKPKSNSRYQFSIRLVKKFTPSSMEVIEDFPNSITIKK
jgi:hypothetical protein